MYIRNAKRSGTDGLTDEEREIAKYGLPPKYDGSRFRTPPDSVGAEEDGSIDTAVPAAPETESREPAVRSPHEAGKARRDGDGPPSRNGDGGKMERLIDGLGERLGTEEMLILALILILSGSGGGECEDAGDVILLLALLLILG